MQVAWDKGMILLIIGIVRVGHYRGGFDKILECHRCLWAHPNGTITVDLAVHDHRLPVTDVQVQVVKNAELKNGNGGQVCGLLNDGGHVIATIGWRSHGKQSALRRVAIQSLEL